MLKILLTISIKIKPRFLQKNVFWKTKSQKKRDFMGRLIPILILNLYYNFNEPLSKVGISKLWCKSMNGD